MLTTFDVGKSPEAKGKATKYVDNLSVEKGMKKQHTDQAVVCIAMP
ncbi:hypothetical protein C5167_046117 [Papaver somniferum]|uniref:Uncharacterized protein n=1 Tax=Papaver somniferum TaxID=3469 RepID=A0A4Y7LGC0_PAPSO|nr:hypothetical protein C5167_046117 [Papaver somniferum]